MPALRWFGRRWRISADDLCCVAALEFAFLTVSGLVALICMTKGPKGTSEESSSRRTSLLHCPGTSVVMRYSFIGMTLTDFLTGVVFAGTFFSSLRGAVFETSKRRAVPLLLYADAAGVLVALILCSISFHYAVTRGEEERCTMAMGYAFRISFALNIIATIIFFATLAISFDPTGHRPIFDTEAYRDLWTSRLRWCFCTFTKRQAVESAYEDVAQVLVSAFRGYDIVPSDLAAGMVLLHGYQARSGRLHAEKVTFSSSLDTRRERLSNQARRVKRLTPEQKDIVMELHDYMPFYIASYGWLLFEYSRCCTGIPRLCCHDPCMACRHHPGKHYGTKFYLDVTALLMETGVREEDVLLTSWGNKIFQPVHTVMLDRRTDSIVISIRGTMSLIDCITDLAALPTVIPLLDHSPMYADEDYFVHGGMYRSAQNVLQSLQLNGIMDVILTGDYRMSKVVLVGQSLGGGVALVMSVLLWSAYPTLRPRLRCLAYSPPGGTLSEAVAEYCKDFTAGCYVGYDMVPRLAPHTFDAFREALLDVLSASSLPKALLFLKACRTNALAQLFQPPGDLPGGPTVSHESYLYRDSMRKSVRGSIPEPKKLYPCATLVHFRKMINRPASRWYGQREEVYVPCFSTPKDVQVIISSPSMFTDHFPDRMFRAITHVQEQLVRGDLERFYVDSTPEVSDADEAPLHFVFAPQQTEIP